jgi:1-acyl-sn-glycerol-3-phosphate acyltransferase
LTDQEIFSAQKGSAFGAFFIWPRQLLALLWFLLTCLTMLLVLPFQWKNPTFGSRFVRLLAWGTHPLLGLKVEIENPQELERHQPCVYVANHQSALDIVTYGTVFPPRTVGTGKRSVRFIPLFGLLYAGSGNILLNRSNHQSSMATMAEIRRRIQDERVSVWIFPEGTRNHQSGELLPFKMGAFHMAMDAGVPLVPLVHENLLHYYDPKYHVVRPGTTIRIRVLPAVPTHPTDNAHELAERVHALMQAEL